MGLVLDSSVLIVAEREAKAVSSWLDELQQEQGENEMVLSSITVVELEHGLHRAQTPEQAQKRRDFLDEVFAAIPVESFSREMAQVAAKVDAEARKTGKVIPFADLLIGATALPFGYSVGTRNPRHFQTVPNLVVFVPLIRAGHWDSEASFESTCLRASGNHVVLKEAGDCLLSARLRNAP